MLLEVAIVYLDWGGLRATLCRLEREGDGFIWVCIRDLQYMEIQLLYPTIRLADKPDWLGKANPAYSWLSRHVDEFIYYFPFEESHWDTLTPPGEKNGL